jgi:hypothetical protein
MRATLLVVVTALALTAGVGVASARPAGCTAGPFSSGSTSGMVFCGPAKATAKVGGKSYSFSGGSCTRTSKYFNINIGTLVLSGPKKKYSYFAILVGAYPGSLPGAKAAGKDGTYAGGLVSVIWQGKAHTLNGAGDKTVKVTLKKGRTAGSFSGKEFFPPYTAISGTFSC